MVENGNSLSSIGVIYILIAGFAGLAMALLPVLPLADADGMLSRIVRLTDIVPDATMNMPQEMINIFWLPFTFAVSCFVVVIMYKLLMKNLIGTLTALIVPSVIIASGVVYVLIKNSDIHIMAILLLPIAGAWWEFNKARPINKKHA